MTWIHRFRKRLRVLLRREEVERELDEEFALHLDLETEKNVRSGMSREEARRQAVLTFGGRERFREEVRDARWANPLLELTPDAKLALRMLVKYPALSVIGGFAMTLAIAVAVGFYTFMAAAYYSVPPLEEGDRIVSLDNANVMHRDDGRSTLFDYHAWREGLRTVRDVSAFTDSDQSLEVAGATPRSVSVARMTASGFRLARVAPLLGRPLLDEDEREGAPPVLVIGEEEWRRDLAGDPDVIGREVRIADVVHTIVGVMPAGFRFPSNHGYWTALGTARATLGGPGEGPHHVVFARIAPGVGRDAVQAEMTALHRRLAAEHPEVYENRRPVVVPYARALFDLQQYPPLLVLAMQLFAVLVLLLIAVNVAVLVYARTASRRAELAVRTALGASRRRIVTQLFVEALALSGVAAALGLGLAQLGYSLLYSIPDVRENVPYWITGRLPLSTVLYTAALAALAAFVIGAVPGLQATGRRLQASLRQMGSGRAIGMGTTWTVLIVAQVAIAVAVLPAVVGLAWNTVWAPPPKASFPAHEALVVRLSPGPAASAPATEQVRRERDDAYAALQAELIRRLAAEPGVADVTYSTLSSAPLLVASEPGGGFSSVGLVEVDTRYLEVLGFRLLAGRTLDPADRTDAPTSVVVSRTLARQVFGDRNPVGRQLWVPRGGEGRVRSYEVVGVVEDRFVRSRGRDLDQATMYLPTGIGADELAILARVRASDPLALLPRAREIARAIAPEHVFIGSGLNTAMRADTGEFPFITTVVGLITLTVLLLSAAGVSAMMSFAVTRRQREIGIRSALGASRGRILWSIFDRSARQVGLGLVAGAGGAIVLDRLAGGGMLEGQELVLPPLVALLMILAGLISTLGPARRALRIQPMEALRLE